MLTLLHVRNEIRLCHPSGFFARGNIASSRKPGA